MKKMQVRVEEEICETARNFVIEQVSLPKVFDINSITVYPRINRKLDHITDLWGTAADSYHDRKRI